MLLNQPWSATFWNFDHKGLRRTVLKVKERDGNGTTRNKTRQRPRPFINPPVRTGTPRIGFHPPVTNATLDVCPFKALRKTFASPAAADVPTPLPHSGRVTWTSTGDRRFASADCVPPSLPRVFLYPCRSIPSSARSRRRCGPKREVWGPGRGVLLGAMDRLSLCHSTPDVQSRGPCWEMVSKHQVPKTKLTLLTISIVKADYSNRK